MTGKVLCMSRRGGVSLAYNIRPSPTVFEFREGDGKREKEGRTSDERTSRGNN